MAYDTDIFTGCEGLFFCLADWSNSVTNGYFWSIILLSMGVIIGMGTANFGFNRAFGYATMSTALIALLLVQLALIPMYILTITLVLAGFGVVAMLVQER